MLSGQRCHVNTTTFLNDFHLIRFKNDVLTALIHLGFLTYNWRKDECYVPNREVAERLAMYSAYPLDLSKFYDRQTKQHSCVIEQG